MYRLRLVLFATIVLGFTACGNRAELSVDKGMGPNPVLPPPDGPLFPTVHIAPAIGWPEDGRPRSASGTEVIAFARGLQHPRWLYVLPNGDVLVAETNAPPRPKSAEGIRGWIMTLVMQRAGAGVPSANRITLLRDTDADGVADKRSVFLEGLNSPFGMALIDDHFYVANTDAIMRFPYEPGQTRISASGTKVTDLPAGPINLHWTKNLIVSPDGSKLYVTVGSNSNVAENGMDKEHKRAAILEVDPETGKQRVFASGLRNPNGLVWHAGSGELWTVVNERDELGSDLVPDYMTRVREGGFYGWPYSYYGQHVDKRVKPQKPEKVAEAISPDYALGPHTAALGLAYADKPNLPVEFHEGMFIGLHGSWNRRPLSGYKVIFVPFKDGRPAGKPIDVLTGFVNDNGEAHGRPVGVAVSKQGDLLVADDVGNTVWRVTSSKVPKHAD